MNKLELGEGNVVTIASRSELAKLPERLRDLVPEGMLELWEDPRAAVAALARKSESPALARWLKQAAKATCSLEIYDVKDFANRAYLRFDLGVSATTVPMPWTVLIDCLTGPVPKGCPPALRNVYSLIGGLCTQYGAAHLLISPPDLVPASRMGAIRAMLDPPPPFDITEPDAVWKVMENEARKEKEAKTKTWWTSLALPFDVTALVPFFYSAGGDYLAYDREGDARWIGNEDGDPDAMPSLTAARCVEDLFATLSARRYFDMGEQQALTARGRGHPR